MTWFIPGLITSTSTVGAGIVGHITTARGYLLPGDIFPRFCSSSELTMSAITVIWSTDDIRTTERAMTDESTVPSFVVEIG